MSEPIQDSNIPLSGKLVSAIIGNFTQRPINGDDSWELCSIGIDADSVVATDSNSAILIGEVRDSHVATQRKEALLEAERAKIYGDPVRLDQIGRNADEAGEAKPMPYVQQTIRKKLDAMKEIAAVAPSALLAIGKVAAAAGALHVQLFQPEGDETSLGFKFRFAPESDHVNLFSAWEGDIKAIGVFKVEKPIYSAPEPKIETPRLSEESVAAPQRKAPKPRDSAIIVETEVIEDADGRPDRQGQLDPDRDPGPVAPLRFDPAPGFHPSRRDCRHGDQGAHAGRRGHRAMTVPAVQDVPSGRS